VAFSFSEGLHGLKPAEFVRLIGATEQLAEKVRTKSESGEGWVSRGQSPTHSADFVGPAKAVPLLQDRSVKLFSKL
jgi:hypothetical protein